MRSLGATYDPTSHYRAARVFDFFAEMQLDAERLRRVSQHQVGLLCAEFDALDLDPEVIDRDRTVTLKELGGFLALEAPAALDIRHELGRAGVSCDARGTVLRLGPAPYLSDQQLRDAVALLGECVRRLPGEP